MKMEHDSDLDGMSNHEDDEDQLLHDRGGGGGGDGGSVEDGYNSEDEVGIGGPRNGGGATNGASNGNNNSNGSSAVGAMTAFNPLNLEQAINRLKAQQQFEDQQHQHLQQVVDRERGLGRGVVGGHPTSGDMDEEEEEEEGDEEEDDEEQLKASQNELAFNIMQRHAAQMAAAAAAAGLTGNHHHAAHFAANLAAVGGLSGLNPSAMCQLNSALLGAAAAASNNNNNGNHNSNSSPSGNSAGGSSSSGGSASSAVLATSSSPSASHLQSIEPGKGYTYEEQFKQLYEINDDPKRKPFLDELFSFMQKRGTPINRIPIMAKQVLDLFELYQLVVARGGLVEVINKKIWREITKGLNLPSSITSAAFTLRTQYMKYLYVYECEKEKLSSPEELQMAIDGNRREGRRSSYGQYPEISSSPPPASLLSAAVAGGVGGGGAGGGGGGGGNRGVNNQAAAAAALFAGANGFHGAAAGVNAALSLVSGRSQNHLNSHHLNSHHHHSLLHSQMLNGHHSNSQGHSSGDEDNGSVSSNPSSSYPPLNLLTQTSSSQHEALNLEVNPRSSNDSMKSSSGGGEHPRGTRRTLNHGHPLDQLTPEKRFCEEPSFNPQNFLMNASFPSTHMKISSKDGKTLEGQLTVSMEINGILYHGILFAQTNRNKME